MSDFKVGCSPLTSRLFAGKVLKNGTWGQTKYDVTDTAVGAVAQHLLQLEEKMQFFTNVDSDNPLVKDVHKNIARHKKELDTWKAKLSKIRGMYS